MATMASILCVALAYTLLLAAALCRRDSPLRRAATRFLRLPPSVRLASAMLSAAAVFYGGAKTNAPLRQLQSPMSAPWEHTLTTAPVAAVPPPAGAVTQEAWRLRGAYRDRARIGAGWRGRLGDALGPVALASGGFTEGPDVQISPVSLAPEANWGLLPDGARSLFWHAVTASNSLLATWQDALVGRSATETVTFQAEMFADGGVEWRLPSGRLRYARVWPFDRDGDGLADAVDPDPDTPGPDAHGTNAQWHNTLCSNVLTAAEADGGVSLEWREGVLSNAYWFAEVVADRGPAAIAFAGAPESRLGDPVVVALGGVTNRVPLLVGVRYAVTSDVPFAVHVPADGFAEVVTNGAADYAVHWPVEFTFTEDVTGEGKAYMVSVGPRDPGGTFTWDERLPMRGWTPGLRSGAGCAFTGAGCRVEFFCGADCGCGGCTAAGTYEYEGVWLAVSGGACGCGDPDPEDPPPDPDPPHDPPPPVPSVTVSVDYSAIVFEGEYTDLPGTNVPRRSSYVAVEVEYSAANNDATGTFSVQSGGSHIILHDGSTNGPTVSSWQFSVGANATGRHVFYAEGLTASATEGDVTFKAAISDGEKSDSDEKDITVVEVRLEPLKTAPANPSPRRHTFGVAEMVKCVHYPSVIPVSWEVGGQANMIFTNGFQTMVCPIIAEMGCSLKATCSGVEHAFNISVLNPSGITCQQHSWGGMDLPKGTAGGAGMYLSLYVEPMTVNFEGIAIQEVPSNSGTHTGYFAQTNQMASWYHDRDNGAGFWHDVTTGNFWTRDNAKVNVKSPPWSFGTKSWKIPIGWNERGTDYLAPHIHELSVSYQQNFIITVEGTVTVMKHEHWASRSTNDCWILDGAIIHGEE